MNAKARGLKRAWNASFGLPDDYPGRNQLMSDTNDYADDCDIDLSKISGY